jgi:hypothetical protein
MSPMQADGELPHSTIIFHNPSERDFAEREVGACVCAGIVGTVPRTSCGQRDPNILAAFAFSGSSTR